MSFNQNQLKAPISQSKNSTSYKSICLVTDLIADSNEQKLLIKDIFSAYCDYTESGWNGVNFLHSFGFLSELPVITQQCFGYRWTVLDDSKAFSLSHSANPAPSSRLGVGRWETASGWENYFLSWDPLPLFSDKGWRAGTSLLSLNRALGKATIGDNKFLFFCRGCPHWLIGAYSGIPLFGERLFSLLEKTWTFIWCRKGRYDLSL